MLCYANHPLWVSTMALQQSSSLISNEDYEQDVKKSGLMDSRQFQNGTIDRY